MDANWRPDLLTAMMIPELDAICTKALAEMIEDPATPPKTRLGALRLAEKFRAILT